MDPLSFFNEGVDFQTPNDIPYTSWIKRVTEENNKILGDVSFIFCSDSHLLELNEKYLNHDTFTDIITFDYTNAGIVSGDVFISIDRITENASKFNCEFNDELHRVMIHGVLHLIGFKDKLNEDAKIMRAKEDEALKMLSSIL